MEQHNKLVVKVKYQGSNKEQKSDSARKMVTEWHIQRIIAVCAILVGLILLFLYFFNAQPSSSGGHSVANIKPVEKRVLKQELKSIEPVVKQAAIEKPVKKKFTKLPAIVAKEELNIDKVEPSNIIKQAIIEKPVISPNLIIFDNPNIVRTLLTTELDNKEPVDTVSALSVNKNNASRIYYFTEIIDMKGQTFYHRWLRNDQLIFLKEINIIGNRWRAATSKLIVYSQAGNWTVRLEDAEGIVLNEINFEVIKE